MLIPDIVRSTSDLEQIQMLQQQNLKKNLTEQEKQEQGFLTLEHSMEILEAMHLLAPSIIVRDGQQLAGYALTELPECRSFIPALEPMFSLLDTLEWKHQPIRDYRYYTMGQICVGKQYRGQGVFEKLYQHHKTVYSQQFELFITEISTSNKRSIRAHEKIGFVQAHVHRDELDEWSLVIWDWS